jgi:DNA replication and repair protein RecF
VYISHLRIENFRNLEAVEIHPEPGLNYFFGENGAGKTSVLEALFLLSRGKSFRTTASEELIRYHANTFQVFAEVSEDAETQRLGLERSRKHWRGRLNGAEVSALSELSRALPMVLMEPNSHALVSGSPDGRRRFLDWGVFHVEPRFLEAWRQYSRGLKQRNAALRRGQSQVIESLDEMLAPLGEQLSEYRKTYFESLAVEFSRQLNSERSGLQDITLELLPGWKSGSLLESLQQGRERDLELGLSQHGPHRADILLARDGRLVRNALSRGEQKNVAASLLLSQAVLLRNTGHGPVILLDDLASEFDHRHFQEVLQKALACADQVWVTGVQNEVLLGQAQTVLSEGWSSNLKSPPAVFHVEHGKVTKVV